MKTTKGLVRKQATSDRASRLLNILQVSLSAHSTARSVRERTARSTQRLFDGIDGGSPQCRLWAVRSRIAPSHGFEYCQGSADAEEALLKRCAHFDLEGDASTALQDPPPPPVLCALTHTHKHVRAHTHTHAHTHAHTHTHTHPPRARARTHTHTHMSNNRGKS